MATKTRPKTHTKVQCSDILEESERNTFVWKSCHGNTDMCTRVPRYGRVSFLLTVTVLALFLHAVGGCDVDVCIEKYQAVSIELEQQQNQPDSDMTNKDRACIVLRTYWSCLENLHGCKGAITYHSAKRVIRNQLNEQNCAMNGPIYEATNPTIVLPPDEMCTYRGATEYKYCGLFGDPHIRTFDSQHQTCRVKGAWPLIENDYLVVMVTNEFVTFSEGATAATMMSVLIKSNPECASDRYILYEATAEQLSSTFTDGQTKYGRSHSVKLEEIDPGKHVEIFIKYIDTRIVIRLVGSYLTFSIKMPVEFLNSSSSGISLCTKGCPKKEIIDHQKYLAYKQRDSVISNKNSSVNMTLEEALELCRKDNLVDFYLDSCVFDLLTTGNETFKHAASAALQDVVKFDPNFTKSSKNRTTLVEYKELLTSSSVRTSSNLNLYTFMVLVSVTLTFMEVILNSS